MAILLNIVKSKLATDKPNGSHAARMPILCHQCQHLPFILGEWICGITILKITQCRPTHIFRLGNCRLFLFLQTLFAPFHKFLVPLLTVLCTRLLNHLRLIFPGNKLHHFLTGKFVRWCFSRGRYAAGRSL